MPGKRRKLNAPNPQVQDSPRTFEAPRAIDPSDLGIDILIDPQNPTVDVIAVHGLGATPSRTWTKPKPRESNTPQAESVSTNQNGNATEERINWLSHNTMLPAVVKNARIMVFNYDSNWYGVDAVKTRLDNVAEVFINTVERERRGCAERPLVLIGHCFGGLVIEKALIKRRAGEIFDATTGVVLLGTPHRGTDEMTAGMLIEQIILAGTHVEPSSLTVLRAGNEMVFDAVQDFASDARERQISIHCFFEMRASKVAKMLHDEKLDFIVNEKSARIDGCRTHGLPLDHYQLNKFSNPEDGNWKSLCGVISDLCEAAPTALSRRHVVGSTATTHGNQHWKVPRSVNGLFTGRAELLRQMQKFLQLDYTPSADVQKRFVITGPGGQGKSEICLKIANLMRKEFWGVFWVDVDKPSTAERDFIVIAKTLGRSAETIPDALQGLATIKHSWLLILDNADDPDFDYQVYLPSGTYGSVIITSRAYDCKKYNTVGAEALEGLQDKDSKELLLKAAEIPEESWPSHSSQAEEVVLLLGSHTLALIQAGAYIARGHCQLYQYPKVYKQQRKRLLEFRPRQAQSRYSNVYATFEASANVLKQSKSKAAMDALELLRVLSMLDASIFPLAVFQHAWDRCRKILRTEQVEARGLNTLTKDHISRVPKFMDTGSDEWDPYRLTEASAQLVALSLVTKHNLEGLSGLSMHPLIHAWAKDRQNSNEQDEAWIAIGCILTLSQSNAHIWQTQERRLLPHIHSYLDIKISRVFLFGSRDLIMPILLSCGEMLLDMRQDSRLHHLLEVIFSELKQKPEQPTAEFFPLYDLQAKSLMNLGKSSMAVELVGVIVKIQDATLAEDHPSRLTSQHALAIAYEANGQVEKAVALLEHVVKIQEATLAEDHSNRLASQHALASAYEANGQVKEAVALLEHVVKIQETTLAEDHSSRLACQHALASAYEANGQVKEAVALLEYVVKIREATLAEDHPSRLASQHALAIAYKANGQVEKAVALLEHVVKIQETTLAEDHPSRLTSQHALAITYEANGQVEKAVALLEHVVKIQETTLAEDHPDRLASQHALALAYRANGQVKEAVALLEHVVKIKQLKFDKSHQSRIASEEWLSYLIQQP